MRWRSFFWSLLVASALIVVAFLIFSNVPESHVSKLHAFWFVATPTSNSNVAGEDYSITPEAHGTASQGASGSQVLSEIANSTAADRRATGPRKQKKQVQPQRASEGSTSASKMEKSKKNLITWSVTPAKGAYFYEFSEESTFAKCDDNCITYGNSTCGQCLTADFATGIFVLRRAFFKNGAPQIFSPSRKMLGILKQCYMSCARNQGDKHDNIKGPPLGNFNGDYLTDFWIAAGFKFSGNTTGMVQKCKTFERIAVVVTDYLMLNLYHFVLERMYEMFVFLGSISHVHKCPDTNIDVFIHKMFTNKAEAPFSRLWEQVMPRRELKEMNGCYDTVYYGLPFRAARLVPAYGRTSLFEYNRERSMWASLFSLRMRNAWDLSHEIKTHSRMLVVRHHRMPEWLWNLKYDFDDVKHIAADFESKTLQEQIKIVSGVRGIISIEGAAMTWQVFLSPRSAIFQFSLASVAMNPLRRNQLPERDACGNTPGACHDIWAAHLGHSVLAWRWCDKRPFDALQNNSQAKVIELLRFLLEGNVKARQSHTAWLCYVLRSSPAKVRNLQINCDVEILVDDHNSDVFRDDRVEGHSKCGSFGGVGPPLLKKFPEFWSSPNLLSCNIPLDCKRYIKWP